MIDFSSMTKEIAVLRYRDGNNRIVNEMELHYIMVKRRFESIWQEIYYIQTYIKPKDGDKGIFRFNYKYEEAKHDELFEKSLRDIKYIGLEALLDKNRENRLFSDEIVFASEEEDALEDTLLKTDPVSYCKYKLFKVCNYLEAFSSFRVISMNAEFVRGEDDLIYFVSVTNLRAIDVVKPLDNKIAFIDLINNQRREELAKSIEEVFRDDDRQHFVEFANNVMSEHYESLKRNIDLEPKYFGMNENIDTDVPTNTADALAMLKKRSVEHSKQREMEAIRIRRLQAEARQALQRDVPNKSEIHGAPNLGFTSRPVSAYLFNKSIQVPTHSGTMTPFNGPRITPTSTSTKLSASVTPGKFFEIATNTNDKRRLKFFKPNPYMLAKERNNNIMSALIVKRNYHHPDSRSVIKPALTLENTGINQYEDGENEYSDYKLPDTTGVRSRPMTGNPGKRGLSASGNGSHNYNIKIPKKSLPYL